MVRRALLESWDYSLFNIVNIQEKLYYVLEGEGKSWFYMSKGLPVG